MKLIQHIEEEKPWGQLIEEAIEKENTMTCGLLARFIQQHNLKPDEVCLVRKSIEDGFVIFPALRSIYDKMPVVYPPED